MSCISKFCVVLALVQSAYSSTPLDTTSKDLNRLNARDALTCKDVDPSLPGSFVCGSNTKCISLDSSSTALCCPENGDCGMIQTIDCDVSQQDPSQHPNAVIFTSRLNEKLPTCGNACCPFGYDCVRQVDGNAMACVINKATSKVNTTAITTSTSTTATTTPSSTTATSTPTSASSGIDSTKPQPKAKCDSFPAGVFLAGFFPGIFIGALGTLGWVICSGRHRKPGSRSGFGARDSGDSDGRSSSDTPPKKGLVISSPIPMTTNNARTDFLRRTTTRAKSMFSTAKGSPETSTPPFSATTAANHWKMPTPPVPNNIPPRPLGIPVTPTPQKQPAHGTSMESIKVYTPANAGPSQLQPQPQQTTNQTTSVHKNVTTPSVPQNPPSRPAFGSPFKTPPNVNNGAGYEFMAMTQPYSQSQTQSQQKQKQKQKEVVVDDNRDNEMLTPSRYQAPHPPRIRPDTTFTDLMLRSGLEKAGGGSGGGNENNAARAVPPIPRGYDQTNRI